MAPKPCLKPYSAKKWFFSDPKFDYFLYFFKSRNPQGTFAEKLQMIINSLKQKQKKADI